MLERYLSASWSAIAPELGNHLWQSTLVAVAAALLTLALRRQHARARYWLWLAASLKFLFPFSWLISLGARLAPTPSINAPALSVAIEELSQPFRPAIPAGAAISAHAVSFSWMHLLPFVLTLWVTGFLAVLLVWAARWRHIRKVIRSAAPISEGRELEMLRRLEHVAGITQPIALLSSSSSLEPGIFGIRRPALIWPEGISRRLEDPHLEAILAHEVWHVRRRDNLSAALHMLVEAIFWFYPLVWWLGARLVDERERACDEEVVRFGSDRQVYAESILKVCEFCLGSPLFCVSGVTGADLKKRVVHIMTDRMLPKLDFARKLLLATAAVSAIAVPVAFGLFHPAAGRAQSQTGVAAAVAPAFESVSIKPDNSDANGVFRTKVMFSLDDGSFTARGVTLEKLIRMAYHLQDSQLSGALDWMNSQKYFVDAKLDKATTEDLRKQTARQPGSDDQAALKSLLSERFKLAFHMESRTVPVYNLVVASGGPKLKESKTVRMVRLERGELTSSGIPISILADELSRHVGHPVVDKTGLKSNYAFSLHWTPDANERPGLRDAGPGIATPESEAASRSVFTALQEQLGLKLDPGTETVQVLVIDHAEPPTEDQ